MTRLYELLKELPPEIQQKAIDILEFLFEKRVTQTESPSNPEANKIPILSSLDQGVKSKIPKKGLRIAIAKSDLVRLYLKKTSMAPQGLKGQAQREFLQAYNLGEYPELYAELGPKSFATIERWKLKWEKKGDPLDLLPRWGEHMRGKTKVSEAQAKCLLSAALKHQRPAAAIPQARKLMREQGVPDTLHKDTYRRFLKRYRGRSFLNTL